MLEAPSPGAYSGLGRNFDCCAKTFCALAYLKQRVRQASFDMFARFTNPTPVNARRFGLAPLASNDYASNASNTIKLRPSCPLLRVVDRSTANAEVVDPCTWSSFAVTLIDAHRTAAVHRGVVLTVAVHPGDAEHSSLDWAKLFAFGYDSIYLLDLNGIRFVTVMMGYLFA